MKSIKQQIQELDYYYGCFTDTRITNRMIAHRDRLEALLSLIKREYVN